MNTPWTAIGASVLACILTTAAGAQPVTTETLTVGTRTLVLEKGTISVPENRSQPGSRMLKLPYHRLRAEHADPAVPPLFLLDGGPGSSNLNLSVLPSDLWGTRDLVQVGYRGVDGETLLPDEAFTKALWNQESNQSEESLKSIAGAYSAFVALCRSRGIDIDGYSPDAVVEDLEALRAILGYGAIDVYGVSYGTRLAYLYGRDHPATTRKLVMVGANPPGHFALFPSDYDAVLAMYTTLYARDLTTPVRKVTEAMPASWLWWPIHRGMVKLGAPLLLANPGTAASFLTAYEKAAAGDASGLAGFSLIAPWMTTGMHAGDLMLKGFVDYVPGRDYLAETGDAGQFGRSFLRGTFAMAQFIPPSDLPRYAPSEARPIEAPTLVLNGSLDTQTPLRGVKADMMPLLPHGTLVTLDHYGHFNAVSDQGPAVARVIAGFLDTGVVDHEAIPLGQVATKPGLDLSVVAWGATGVTVAAVAAVVATMVWLLSR